VNEDKNGVMLRCNTEVIAFEVQGETPDWTKKKKNLDFLYGFSVNEGMRI
jgi:hypothetical protein